MHVLQTPCQLCEAHDPTSGHAHPKLEAFTAIWDTGAMGSVITEDVVTRCGLKPTGMVQVHGVHGAATAETYLVNLVLPNRVAFANIRVTKGQLAGGADALIGMDIITRGDLSITNMNGKTVMSFRCPSCEAVDFVAQAKKASMQAAPAKYSQGGFSGGKGKKNRKKRH